MKTLTLTLALLLILLTHLPAQIWDGGAGTGNWGDALNWNTNTVPPSGANVTFSGTVQTLVNLQTNRTLGTLTLAATSTIDLGSGNSILQFANSAAPPWNPSAQLPIHNWSGLLTGGGTDQIYFGNNSSGLTPAKLAQIQFINPAGLTPGTYAATILSTGEIVPVPEPTALLTAALLLILCLFLTQKKKRP